MFKSWKKKNFDELYVLGIEDNKRMVYHLTETNISVMDERLKKRLYQGYDYSSVRCHLDFGGITSTMYTPEEVKESVTDNIVNHFVNTGQWKNVRLIDSWGDEMEGLQFIPPEDREPRYTRKEWEARVEKEESELNE